MRTLKGDSRAYMMAGLGMAGIGVAATIGSLLAGGGALTNALDGLGPLLVIGAGLFGLGAARLPGWARRRREQMDEIAARIEALPEGSPEPKR
jgi:hypothetical protein